MRRSGRTTWPVQVGCQTRCVPSKGISRAHRAGDEQRSAKIRRLRGEIPNFEASRRATVLRRVWKLLKQKVRGGVEVKQTVALAMHSLSLVSVTRIRGLLSAVVEAADEVRVAALTIHLLHCAFLGQSARVARQVSTGRGIQGWNE